MEKVEIRKKIHKASSFDNNSTNSMDNRLPNECCHYLESDGSYRIDNYDKVPAFSSFLPGIAGPAGVPLWCMYVSRGQGVVSFGVSDKDNAILEFLPATWAYQLVQLQGFRTFCKCDGKYYEPFQCDQASIAQNYSRSMEIGLDRLRLQENNETIGLRFEVDYVAVVNRTLPALLRRLKVTNTSSRPRRLEILDGLPLILPAGYSDFGMKKMRHILEAYATAELACDNVATYCSRVQTHDEAEVIEVTERNFYGTYLAEDGHLNSIQPYVDPDIIFGADQDFVTPRRFIESPSLPREEQLWENRLPCAMTGFERMLAPGETVTLFALAGHTPHPSMLKPFLGDFKTVEDIDAVFGESRALFDSITSPAFTVSRYENVDAYARQNFLDNVLRGGVPKMLPAKRRATPLYLYTRRHGDLERDYNSFKVQAHPLSSGPGNYRDVCQNRRNNAWFYPEINDADIRLFASLIQADGYNPLAVHGYKWQLPEQYDHAEYCPAQNEKAKKDFSRIVRQNFLPGQLLNWVREHHVKLKDPQTWLLDLLGKCNAVLVASGHEGGYWIDHWTYIVDLLDSYSAIYPDRIVPTLTEAKDISWFDDGARVAPRSEKYLLRSKGPLQLKAVTDGKARSVSLPAVNMLAKLVALIAVKSCSFDHAGRGIEMEAGRPGWNDSLNGLPGLFGSSTCEAAELARLAEWLLKHLPNMPDVELPRTVAEFVEKASEQLSASAYDWDRATEMREQYFAKVYADDSSEVTTVSGRAIHNLLKTAVALGRNSVERSINAKNNLLHTYYINTPADLKVLNHGQAGEFDPDSDPVNLSITAFEQKPLPLYLEGQVHWLRLIDDPAQAGKVYQAVHRSPLLDEKLQMYKLNECLAECSPDIGRARTFSRGWFENESIWQHMSYKYLLELLKAGLHQEFYNDARTMLVPFMDPKVYGRSILENSSFIASSACPDPNARGRGFIARLSGATAEFIHMWLLITVGAKPFYMRDGQLHFQLSPALPKDWFLTESRTVLWKGRDLTIPSHAFACALFGDIMLIYHNPHNRDTFGPNRVQPIRYQLDDGPSIKAEMLSSEFAAIIRNRKCQKLQVWLG